MAENFYSFKVKNSKSETEDLSKYSGKVVLVVNVASKCGFTPQYAGLEKLYQDWKDKGLTVLGFPCNQFGAQEPGTDAEVQQFCQLNFGVSFPVMAKIKVNGEGTEPLYQWLKSSAPGLLGTEAIKWNFTKFLVSKDGTVLERFAPTVEPLSMTKAIEKALAGS